MPSELQLIANRANSLKSTGPRTDEGKSASRLNATSHGLSSSLLDSIVPQDQFEDFESFSIPLLSSLNPQGPLELLLARQIILRAYQLLRIQLAESDLLQSQRDAKSRVAQNSHAKALEHHRYQFGKGKSAPPPPSPPPDLSTREILPNTFNDSASSVTNPFERLQRYAGNADLAFHRDLKQLLNLQKLRRSRPQEHTPPPDETPSPPPMACDTSVPLSPPNPPLNAITPPPDTVSD